MNNKLKKTILSIILTISLVLNPVLVYAGDDPGFDDPSASESVPSPTPEPTPSSSPAAESSPIPSASPSPSPSSWDGPSYASPDDQDGNDDYETPEERAAHEAEKEARWLEYQAWLASQQTGENSTGGVEGGGNVGDTSIETGDADANGVVVTGANTTAVSTGDSACSVCPQDTSVTNSGNGTNSDNSATVNNTGDSTVTINNQANVDNNLNFDANSGNNDASANVGDSEIITGDANVVVTVITEANETSLGVYQFDVNGNQNGDIILDSSSAIAQNLGNGSNSTNDATINNTNTNVETITNDGNIVNNINIDATTGQNSASKNTGGDSSIETGDANVVANVVNVLNTVVDGTMNVVNIFGDMVGNIVQPTIQADTSSCSCNCPGDVTAANVGNGSDSVNTSTVNNTNTNTTNMTNNATVDNNLYLDGNTGGNTTSDNTGGTSSIETGDVTVDANVINIANVNVSAGSCEPIYFVFINDISGDWQGQILGAAPGTYFYTSDGSIYFVDQNGQLVALNKDNGSGSVNNSTINNTNTNTTDITNNGTITNNINIDANTGDNDASKNTNGDSSITTGDANIAANVVNFINSNFSGRKVVMTLVNVFGSWLGNFVPAGYTGEIPQVGGANVSANSASSGGSSSSGSGSSSSSTGGNSSVNSGNAASGSTIASLINQNFFGGGSSGGSVSGANSGGGGAQVQSITTYKAGNNPFDFGMPIALRMAIAFAILSLGTILLRKKAVLKTA